MEGRNDPRRSGLRPAAFAEEERSLRSPLAETAPPPISLVAVRRIAAKSDGELPPPLLEAMRTQLLAQGHEDAANELATLFDLETGRARHPRDSGLE